MRPPNVCWRRHPRQRQGGRRPMLQITRSWELIQESWRVLQSDKALAIYPLLSAICTAIAVAVFVLPVAALMFLADRAARGAHQFAEPLAIPLLFLFYL